MSATFADIFIHVVWGTFGRTPWILEQIEKPLYVAMANKCRKLRCPPIALGGTVDHVHLLVALSPTIALATLIKEIKGASAHLVTHELLPDIAFRWQRGYGAFSLRKSDMDVVRKYVLNQKNHHLANSIATEWEPHVDDDSFTQQ